MKKIKLVLAMSVIGCAMLISANSMPIKALPGDTPVTIQLSDELGNPITGISEIKVSDDLLNEVGVFTTDSSGKVELELPQGRYQIDQISLSDNANYSMVNETLMLDISDNQPILLNIEHVVNRTYFTMAITDKIDTNVGIKGVEIGFYDENKQLLFTLISDQNGLVTYESESDICYPIYNKVVKYAKILSTPSSYPLNNDDSNFQELSKGDRVISNNDKPAYYYRLSYNTLSPVITPDTVSTQKVTTTKANSIPKTNDTSNLNTMTFGMIISSLGILLVKKVKI